MIECRECQAFGLRFKRNYEPVQFLEGRPTSIAWIIGLNPAVDQDWVDSRSESDLHEYFNDTTTLHPYFKDFENVSPELFKMLGKDNGVAHTDLIKCSSKKWPPDTCKGKKAKIVITNCKKYLIEQIVKYKPKLIICNGAPVSKEILSIIKPPIKKVETYYTGQIGGARVTVVLSGFIGRIDNYSKRRLGVEIEYLFNKIINQT